MKKFIALICTMLCMMSMAACSNTAAEEVNTDIEAIEAAVESNVDYFYQTFSSMTPEMMEQFINAKNSEISEDVDMALVLKRGVTAWRDVQADIGAFVSVDGFEMTEDNGTYSGILTMTYELRKVDFIVVFNEDMTTIEAIKIEPEYTIAEKMTNAGLNTLLGMGIVFFVLIFIAFIISLFKYINKFEYWLAHKNDKKDEEQVFVPNNAGNAPETVAGDENMIDDLELVAVITAAIAASMNTSVDNLVVRSIRKRNKKR